MKIAIITPTRSREEQLSLVIDCMNKQTRKPDEWVIVDDGTTPVSKQILDKSMIPCKYIHYNSGLPSSTCMNSAKCLEEARADQYIFIDDDDYYPINYVENFSKLLVNQNEMVGNSRWVDYRLSTGYWRERNKSLYQLITGDLLSEWHGSGIMGEELKQAMINALKERPTDRYNDCVCFDRLFKTHKYVCRLQDFMEWSAISLKDYGVGNTGAIESHFSNNGLEKDVDYKMFKTFLGEDWKRYEKYLGRKG